MKPLTYTTVDIKHGTHLTRKQNFMLKIYLLQFLLHNTSCLAFRQKLQGMLKTRKSSLSRQMQASDPHLDLTQILELSYMESKLNTINKLRAIMEKGNNTQDKACKQRGKLRIKR